MVSLFSTLSITDTLDFLVFILISSSNNNCANTQNTAFISTSGFRNEKLECCSSYYVIIFFFYAAYFFNGPLVQIYWFIFLVLKWVRR